MGRRAEALAGCIEEGANGLAAFAEGLSDAEWGTPTPATDRRTVGQIVNHVALVCPIEIDWRAPSPRGPAQLASPLAHPHCLGPLASGDCLIPVGAARGRRRCSASGSAAPVDGRGGKAVLTASLEERRPPRGNRLTCA